MDCQRDANASQGHHFAGYDERVIKNNKKLSTLHDKFRWLYGIDAAACCHVFEDLQAYGILHIVDKKSAKEKTLTMFLIVLFFLRHYPTETELESRFNVSARKLRDNGIGMWPMLEKIQVLKEVKILWPEEWTEEHADDTIDFICTIDGTHCKIDEPRHPTLSKDKSYFSHKFRRAALSYELAIHLSESSHNNS